MTLPDPTAAALVEWTEARGDEPGPFFHRLDGPRRPRTFDSPGNRSAGSFAGWARLPACPATFAPMACATARQHRPSMLAAISATSGDSPAIALLIWY